MKGSSIAVNRDILDKHINASETVDNLIDSKKQIQCIAINNPIEQYLTKLWMLTLVFFLWST